MIFVAGEAPERVQALLDGVAHDLRNPVNTLMMVLNLFERTGHGDLAARGQRALDRMSRLDEQLLLLLRVGASLSLDRSALSVSELIARAQKLAGVATRVSDGAGDTSLDVDAGYLPSALAELLRNAVEHGSAAEAHLTVAVEPENIRLTVESPAPIEAELVPLLFDPLKRLEARGKRRPSGLGLGLYLARAVVEAHGGRVALDDFAGPTRFSLHLPLASQEK